MVLGAHISGKWAISSHGCARSGERGSTDVLSGRRTRAVPRDRARLLVWLSSAVAGVDIRVVANRADREPLGGRDRCRCWPATVALLPRPDSLCGAAPRTTYAGRGRILVPFSGSRSTRRCSTPRSGRSLEEEAGLVAAFCSSPAAVPEDSWRKDRSRARCRCSRRSSSRHSAGVPVDARIEKAVATHGSANSDVQV